MSTLYASSRGVLLGGAIEDEFFSQADDLLKRQQDLLHALEQLRLSGRTKDFADSNTKKKEVKEKKPKPKKKIRPISPVKTNITRRRFEDYINELKKKEEEEYIFKKFKARSAPSKLLEPKYHLLEEKEKLRRQTVSERRRETMERVTRRLSSIPESATEGEEEEEVAVFQMFKANPLPKYLESMPKPSKASTERHDHFEHYSFHPKISGDVPDFKRIHEQLPYKISERKQRAKESSNTITRKRTVVPKNPKTTKAFLLFEQNTKAKLEKEDVSNDDYRKERELFLKSKIRNAISYVPIERDKIMDDKLEMYRKETRAQSKKYEKFLSHINSKLDKRPCVFERVALERAVASAEKLFNETLDKHGVKLGE